MQELIITLFVIIWLAVILAFMMHLHVYVTLKEQYRQLWEELFSGGASNIKYWKWLGKNEYSEIDDLSFRKQLTFTNRIWWFITIAVGTSLLLGIVAVIWTKT